jgi:hypothetical protein
MKDVGVRIESIINHYKLNVNSFSKAIGLTSNVTIFRIVGGHSAPSFATLSKIKQAYPEINIDWILGGTGEMLLIEQKEISWYEKQLASAKKEIEWHRELVETLKVAINNQTENEINKAEEVKQTVK